MNILEISNLTTGYKQKKGDNIIARNLNASLTKGTLTCLLGPNGCGKSTLLRTLAAFQPPLSGEVLIEGSPLSSYSTRQLAQLISIVLTDNSNITGMTVYNVIAMGRSPYTDFWGRLQPKDKEIIDQSIDLVGIRPLIHRRMQTLSDGERQKVMIAKAIAQQTPIIFLDEPTAYLDYPSKVQTLLLLHHLTRTLGKTIFLSTHDIEHALLAADNIWLLDRKKGLATGTATSLGNKGKIGEYFNSNDMTYNPISRRFEINLQDLK